MRLTGTPTTGAERRRCSTHSRCGTWTSGTPTATPVLHGLSFELERGEWLTLVGPNGSGKTTVAALLLGLYRPWRGSVAADGVPYDELDLQALRRRIGFVPQRPILFPASIAENIAYGTGTVDAARVHEAAELATVDEFVDGLDHGYRTPVGDGGRPPVRR